MVKVLKYKPTGLICIAKDLFGNDVFMKKLNRVKSYKNSGRVYVFKDDVYLSFSLDDFFCHE